MWHDENGEKVDSAHQQLLRLHQRGSGGRRVPQARRHRSQLFRTAGLVRPLLRRRLRRRPLRPRRQLPRTAGDPGALPEQFRGDPRRPCRELLQMEQPGVRRTGRLRPSSTHPDDTEKLHRDLGHGHGDLAARTAGHHAHPGLPPPAVDDRILDAACRMRTIPYTNSAQWHLTFPLVLHRVQACTGIAECVAAAPHGGRCPHSARFDLRGGESDSRSQRPTAWLARCRQERTRRDRRRQ